MDLILKYFPDLTEEQKRQFAALYDLYLDWNSKINVISRKDIENLYEHHVLHSLGIAKVIRFRPGTQIMDLGTIRLDDLFEGDYKEALTDLLWKQLMADNNVSTRQELEDMGYATTGDLEPIENFYLDPTGITFYYNVYEIAPYVMGATKITLSYEDIAHLMNGEFITLSSAIKADGE